MARVSSGEVELAAFQAGDPARPAVVLIHGYPDTKAMWQPVIDSLREHCHAIAYDVRGAGESSAPRGAAAYDLERLGDDLLAVADQLAPGKRVHLVGHDWGGIQGWEFATSPRFEDRLASFTAIAAPSLDQVALVAARRRRDPLRWLWEARRSWYIGVLLTPGGPEAMWRGVVGARGWRAGLRLDQVPVDASYPAPTLVSDGIHGANLYRRNIPRRMRHPRRDARAHVPVQLIVPTGDRFIPESYYELAEEHAPRLRRRMVSGPHWLPRTEPELVAGWIADFVEAVERGEES